MSKAKEILNKFTENNNEVYDMGSYDLENGGELTVDVLNGEEAIDGMPLLVDGSVYVSFEGYTHAFIDQVPSAEDLAEEIGMAIEEIIRNYNERSVYYE